MKTIAATATSFADVADLIAFNKAIRAGKTVQQALSVGDNGVGAWGMSTVAGTGPACALPAPYGFHSGKARVYYQGKTVDCEIRDRGPRGRIDLNPDAWAALGQKPPMKVKVQYEIV